MRRLLILLVIISLVLLSCRAVTLPLAGILPGTSTPLPPSPTIPQQTPTDTPAPSLTPSLLPSPTVTPTPSATITPTPEPNEAFEVRYHPEGGLYAGDQVSMEVIPRAGVDLQDQELQVRVSGVEGLTFDSADFGRFGIGGRYQATLTWAWDTTGLPPGEHALTYSILPDGPEWIETVTLLPAEAVPPPEPHARWATTETDCCLLYYITGTEAERDLSAWEGMADEQATAAAAQLETVFEQAIPIVLVPRVLGHGGFASDEISISYLDRNYAGSSAEMVLHHEMIHILDGRLGGELRPTLFVEGLAVYLTGGHFKPEELMPRTAALLDLGLYLPLASLADDFYPAQHETGYLEGASLVEYMVRRWGWQAFSTFYRDIHPDPSKSQSKAIDIALQKHFNLTFADLEEQFKQALREIEVTGEMRDDVRLTLGYYDTVRRYQQALDPSAYFMTAWLPDGKEMRERGIVADYLRHPSETENIALEAMLVNTDGRLRSSDYPGADQTLEAVNAVLAGWESGLADPFEAHPLAANVFEIVQSLSVAGYEVQQVEVMGNTAQVWATTARLELQELELVQQGDGWNIQ